MLTNSQIQVQEILKFVVDCTGQQDPCPVVQCQLLVHGWVVIVSHQGLHHKRMIKADI